MLDKRRSWFTGLIAVLVASTIVGLLAWGHLEVLRVKFPQIAKGSFVGADVTQFVAICFVLLASDWLGCAFWRSNSCARSPTFTGKRTRLNSAHSPLPPLSGQDVNEKDSVVDNEPMWADGDDSLLVFAGIRSAEPFHGFTRNAFDILRSLRERRQR